MPLFFSLVYDTINYNKEIHMKAIINTITNTLFMLLALVLAIPMMLFYGLTGKYKDGDVTSADIDSMIKATEGKYYRVRSYQEGEA